MRPVAGPSSSSRRTIIEIDSWIDLFLHSYFIRDDSLQSDEDWWNVVKVQKRTKFSSLSLYPFTSLPPSSLLRFSVRFLHDCCLHILTTWEHICDPSLRLNEMTTTTMMIECVRERENVHQKRSCRIFQRWNMQLITIGEKRRRALHRHFRSFDIRKC